MIVYLARAIQAFVMYCVNGTSRSSFIESTDSMIYIHRGETLGGILMFEIVQAVLQIRMVSLFQESPQGRVPSYLFCCVLESYETFVIILMNY